jgi:trk system potassium uptake protein
MASSNAAASMADLTSPAPAGRGDIGHSTSPLMLIGTAMIGPLYLLVAGLGAAGLRQAAFDPATPMTMDKSVFTAVNALTLTGFSQSVGIEEYRAGGQQIILTLTLLGALMTWVIGAMAITRIIGLRFSAFRITLTAIVLELLAAALGLLFLAGPDRAPFAALFQATAAVGNSALTIGAAPAITDAALFLILLPLATIGSLGIIVILELVQWPSRRTLSDFTRVALSMTAGIYLLAFAAMALMLYPNWHDADSHPFLLASALAIDARGYGLPIDSISHFPRLMQWFLIPLMMLGGCAGASAAGLKLNSLAEFFRGARQAASRKITGHGFAIALIWLGIYLAIAIGCFACLLYTDPQTPGEQLLFNAISATSNVGLSQSTIIAGSSTLLVYSVTMLAGRIAPLLMLWSMVESNVTDSLPVG